MGTLDLRAQLVSWLLVPPLALLTGQRNLARIQMGSRMGVAAAPIRVGSATHEGRGDNDRIAASIADPRPGGRAGVDTIADSE